MNPVRHGVFCFLACCACFRSSMRCALLATLFIALFHVPLSAQPEDSAKGAPINIEADRMTSQENSNTIIFSGNVYAKQGKMTIRAAEMTAYYNKGKESNKENERVVNQIEKLVCTGNVRIDQGNWLGTGDRMDYFAKERKVVLSGHAKAWHGQDMVSGKSITYYLDEKRSVVDRDVNSKDRVQFRFHPSTNN